MKIKSFPLNNYQSLLWVVCMLIAINLNAQTTTTYEAEDNYEVITDFEGEIALVYIGAFSNEKGVNIYNTGDRIGIDVTAASAGDYIIKVQVRSGNSNGNTTFWPDAYEFALDDTTNIIALTGDTTTVVAITELGGGAVGIMESEELSLTAGTHRVFIKMLGGWGAVDYVSITGPVNNNQSPVADAGVDQTITLPTSSVTLNGSGSDPDGESVTYNWSQLSGPNTASFSSTTIVNPTVSGLIEGSYQFQLAVTDQSAAITYDTLAVTVNPAAVTSTEVLYEAEDNYEVITDFEGEIALVYIGAFSNEKGVNIYNTGDRIGIDVTAASAGDYIIKVQVRSGNSNGNTTFWPDAYEFALDDTTNIIALTGDTTTVVAITELGGGAVGIMESEELSLTAGTHRVFIKMLGGWGAVDYVSITGPVNNNQSPVADAGVDQTITLPTSSVTLNGSGSDPDGESVTYNWSQLSGPNTASFSSTTIVNPTVSGLIEGSYQFQLAVTDQSAAITYDTLAVTVNPAAVTSTEVLYEAEDNYEVITDFEGEIGLVYIGAFSNEKGVNLYNTGDRIGIDVTAASAGDYIIKAHVRSGNSNGNTTFWPDAYEFALDDTTNIITLAGDTTTVVAITELGGGAVGVMESEELSLTAGTHRVFIKMLGGWGAVDYVSITGPIGNENTETRELYAQSSGDWSEITWSYVAEPSSSEDYATSPPTAEDDVYINGVLVSIANNDGLCKNLIISDKDGNVGILQVNGKKLTVHGEVQLKNNTVEGSTITVVSAGEISIE
ncbi:PKD domain-containing protein [Chondrinema litorale]|uniref:PKD domain-containing protein n=1 Tax=Chondrinema litorale TaxID=2994555 RepID=UPI00254297B6|nr:hypothetical protein [Chondrinema litorale]UZR97142.1 hypothetical protein OQ292_23885 [Chondrinema litorale]